MMTERDNMPVSARWVADFIQRIGFPIFIACAIFAYHVWYVNTIQKQQDENAAKVTTALEKSTEAITALRHFLLKKYD